MKFIWYPRDTTQIVNSTNIPLPKGLLKKARNLAFFALALALVSDACGSSFLRHHFFKLITHFCVQVGFG